MKITFFSEPIAELCSGCKKYGDHWTGKDDENHHVFKCKGCGRITIWIGGDNEKVVTHGS